MPVSISYQVPNQGIEKQKGFGEPNALQLSWLEARGFNRFNFKNKLNSSVATSSVHFKYDILSWNTDRRRARWSVRAEESSKRDPAPFALGASVTPGNLQMNSNGRDSDWTFPGCLGLTLLLLEFSWTSSSAVRCKSTILRWIASVGKK